MINKEKTQKKMEEPFKLYKIRWLVLFLTAIASAIANMQWMQYGIIGDVVMLYYGVSFDAVNWSSMVYLLVYVVLVFPLSYVLDKYGIKCSMLLAVVGTAAGAWIKVGSVSPDRYWVLLLGQFVVAVATVPVMGLPPKVAAIWFGPNEVSTACGVGLAGIQVGFAVGFVVPPIIITSQTDLSIIESDLFAIALGVAIICTIQMVAVIAHFPDKPKTPPSQAALQNQDQEVKLFQPLKKLMTNKAFVLVLIAFGINLGIFCAISTLLNQVVLTYYPDGFIDAGRIGLLMVVAGFCGSLAGGAILDKFRAYKVTLMTLEVILFLSLIVFTCTLTLHIALIYITMGLAGFLMGGIWSVSFEVVVETTYPEPEGIAVGLLNGLGQAFGIAFTVVYSALFHNSGTVWANVLLTILSLLALILVACVRMEFRREAANFKKENDNLAFDDALSTKL